MHGQKFPAFTRYASKICSSFFMPSHTQSQSEDSPAVLFSLYMLSFYFEPKVIFKSIYKKELPVLNKKPLLSYFLIRFKSLYFISGNTFPIFREPHIFKQFIFTYSIATFKIFNYRIHKYLFKGKKIFFR